MGDSFERLKQRLVDAVINGPAECRPGLRLAALRGVGLPAPLAGLIEKVHRHAYRIDDEEVARLKEAGYGDDALFELVTAAAVGASLVRLEAGLRALRGERGPVSVEAKGGERAAHEGL